MADRAATIGLNLLYLVPEQTGGMDMYARRLVPEAMQRGLPVACARASALPEVAGAAASYFDPCDVGDIARALDAVLADRTEAARLSEAGRRRARTFTGQRAARGTRGSYDRAMRDARR
jgi:glycosyltransferase involved in cell wall biosynthesis